LWTVLALPVSVKVTDVVVTPQSVIKRFADFIGLVNSVDGPFTHQTAYRLPGNCQRLQPAVKEQTIRALCLINYATNQGSISGAAIVSIASVARTKAQSVHVACCSKGREQAFLCSVLS
jgi:hypothetical protein